MGIGGNLDLNDIKRANRKIYLMCKDTIVIVMDFVKNEYILVNGDLLPFQIRGKYWNSKQILEGMEKGTYEYAEASIQMMRDRRDSIVRFLTHRVLLINRKHWKEIMNLLLLDQKQDERNFFAIALACHGVSVLDNYWLKIDGEEKEWKNMNVRKNSLNEVIAQVALHGKSRITLTGELMTPELTTQGEYAKCWKRMDGKLYLLKAGDKNGLEPKKEIEVSNILNKTNVRHVVYLEAKSEGVFCSKCECMSDDRYSIIDASDFRYYCEECGMDAIEQMYKIDADTMYKMGIVDYLIANSDRHLGNFGFYYNSEDMQLISCHPLFDHNNAFGELALEYGDKFRYALTGGQIFDYARECMEYTEFKFITPLSKSDFYFPEHYEIVLERAAKLGLYVPVV